MIMPKLIKPFLQTTICDNWNDERSGGHYKLNLILFWMQGILWIVYLINDSCMATGKKDKLRRTSVRVLGDSEIISLVHSPVAMQYLYTFHARVPAYNVLPSLSQRNITQIFCQLDIARFVMLWKRFRHMHGPYSWCLPLSLILNSSFSFPLNRANGLNIDLMSKQGCQTSNPQENRNIKYWTTIMDEWTILKGS